MFETKKSDLVWSWIIIGLTIAALVWGLIPGLMTMYDVQTDTYIPACLWKVPSSNIMANVAPLLIVAFAYCLLTGFIYLRNQTIGSIRGLFIMSIVCCLLSLMSLMPRYTVEKWPYSVIPCIFAVQTVVSFIRMKLQQHELDKFEAAMDAREEKDTFGF